MAFFSTYQKNLFSLSQVVTDPTVQTDQLLLEFEGYRFQLNRL